MTPTTLALLARASVTARERFLASMHFEPRDHPPYWEWAYWIETLRR